MGRHRVGRMGVVTVSIGVHGSWSACLKATVLGYRPRGTQPEARTSVWTWVSAGSVTRWICDGDIDEFPYRGGSLDAAKRELCCGNQYWLHDTTSFILFT